MDSFLECLVVVGVGVLRVPDNQPRVVASINKLDCPN